MKIIESKRHPLKFYTSLIFGFLFLFALGSIMVSIGFKEMQFEQPKTKLYVMFVFGISSCFMAVWLVYSYWKNAPKITIDKYNLKIGNETFYIQSIKDIALTGKMPFRFILNFPMEGIAILFNDGKEKILFDDMYANSHELKLFLEQVVINKQEFKPNSTIKIGKNELWLENVDIFKGNQFTSFRGISLWVFIGFFAVLTISKWQSPGIRLLIFFGILGSFWFIACSWAMHYFGLTKNYLIVRNHNFIWKEKIYLLSDIKEIVFETQGNQANSMRIITNDFRNKLYQAGTLRDKTWLEMKTKLEEKGITVRNECIF